MCISLLHSILSLFLALFPLFLFLFLSLAPSDHCVSAQLVRTNKNQLFSTEFKNSRKLQLNIPFKSKIIRSSVILRLKVVKWEEQRQVQSCCSQSNPVVFFCVSVGVRFLTSNNFFSKNYAQRFN